MIKIILIIALPIILCSCSLNEEKTGCERFKKIYIEDCEWCEKKGGKYMASPYKADCVFTNKNKVN